MTLYLVTEDELSEFVLQAIINNLWPNKDISYKTIGRKGKGYIKSRINDFNNTNNTLPFIILIDLDTAPCAPQVINLWLKRPCRSRLLFRIAIKEVESWLLADTKAISKYLNISHDFIKKEIQNPDSLPDPKVTLINLVDKSKKGELKRDIVQKEAHLYKQGPGYNSRLIEFVNTFWGMERALKKSESLDRTIQALRRFRDQL
jgi:hypothetical protein